MPAVVKRRDLGYRPEFNWTPDTEPDPLRQAQLQRIREENTRAGLPPYCDEKLMRADINWLIVQNGGPIHYGEDYQGRLGLDLRRANLMDVDCSGLPLADTLLQDAKTDDADFTGADLRWAHFEGAHMSATNFTGADLFKAHFEQTYLREVDFRSANLRSAWFDDGSFLDAAHFDGASLSGCHWRSVDLTRVPWQEVRSIGDEADAYHARLAQRAEEYGNASDAYGRVSQLLRSQGRLSDASRFYYRSRIMRRKLLQYTAWNELKAGHLFGAARSISAALGHLLLESVTGYGELPLRVIGWFILVVAVFSALYMQFGSTSTQPFSFGAAVVFSVTSLLGRGYALTLPPAALASPTSILSAIEACIGVALELLFVTTFTRRLIGS